MQVFIQKLIHSKIQCFKNSVFFEKTCYVACSAFGGILTIWMWQKSLSSEGTVVLKNLVALLLSGSNDFPWGRTKETPRFQIWHHSLLFFSMNINLCHLANLFSDIPFNFTIFEVLYNPFFYSVHSIYKT